MAADSKTKTTILKLRRHKRTKEKTCMVTAYDYPQALIADKAGVDVILVGDSCGMTTHGYKTTLPVTMDEMVNHCEAVSRGAKDAFLVGDMPYMSYQPSDQIAVENAGRFIKAGMDCAKVEGAMIDRVKAIVESGIMVMSHLVLTPHTRAKLGGYRVQGKTVINCEPIEKQILYTLKKIYTKKFKKILLNSVSPYEPGKKIFPSKIAIKIFKKTISKNILKKSFNNLNF